MLFSVLFEFRRKNQKTKTDVKALAEKPAKRWESVVAAIITGVVAFVLGLVLRGGV